MSIPYKYTNRKDEDHYFRAVETAKGKVRYYIVKNKIGYTDLIEEVPNGFEVVELPEEGRVIIRKKIPKKITEEERLIVEDAVRELSAFNDFIIFVNGNQLTVFHSQFNSLAGQEENLTAEEADEMYYGETKKWKRYFEGMFFTLIDERKRIFSVKRPVFTNWFSRGTGILEKSDDLMYLADKYCQHLGKDTFFDLIPLEWIEEDDD
ncbi:hypothetical protein [Emticicia agri]|uniref:Uncharacterized protein n=1 Tax=Emticicia agri TaxID=2492393 RepID=A0A4Q5LVC5_9BACT|nr:hypothetical protein [Emticicia agri]RYU93676.1 hypothetical protein EWM59_20790 [Emticicia agri]